MVAGYCCSAAQITQTSHLLLILIFMPLQLGKVWSQNRHPPPQGGMEELTEKVHVTSLTLNRVGTNKPELTTDKGIQ